jgi:hypothetical protein
MRRSGCLSIWAASLGEIVPKVGPRYSPIDEEILTRLLQHLLAELRRQAVRVTIDSGTPSDFSASVFKPAIVSGLVDNEQVKIAFIRVRPLRTDPKTPGRERP